MAFQTDSLKLLLLCEAVTVGLNIMSIHFDSDLRSKKIF